MESLNPLLDKLQPYPFEKLRRLLAGAAPNPALEPINLSIGEPKHPTPALVKSAFVAVRPNVKLERFQLDAQAVRDVVERERGEIRLPGHRAETRELRDLHVDPVVTAARWIRKSLQLFAGTRRHWLGKKRPEK